MENLIHCIKISCINCENEISKNFTEKVNITQIAHDKIIIKNYHLHCLTFSNKIDYNNNYLSEIVKCSYCNKTVGCNVISSTEAFFYLLDNIILNTDKVFL
jgi:hypothetical protein